MSGNPSDYDIGGVWAFKERSRAVEKMIKGLSGSSLVTAYGAVALWGEIVEHEDGYRAEFADIISIDDVHLSAPSRRRFWRRDRRKDIINELRERYGVGSFEAATWMTPPTSHDPAIKGSIQTARGAPWRAFLAPGS